MFFSFQRYALLLVAVSTVPFGLALCFFEFKWWAFLIYAPFFLGLNFFASRIATQWSIKFLVVKRAYLQLSRGQFRPERYAKYCTDPCWRLVVNHILKKAGFETRARKELLNDYQAKAADMSGMMTFVDRSKGTVQMIENGRVRTSALKPKSEARASNFISDS